MPAAGGSSLGAALAASLRQVAPTFGVRGAAQVEVRSTPRALLQALQRGVSGAQSRAALAALYVGAGDEEQALMQQLGARLRERPQLQGTVLLDYRRGRRAGGGGESSATLLASCLPLEQDNCRAALHAVPTHGALLRRLLPVRVSEAAGVSHLKLAVFDDDVLFTGANLSADYFDRRQDRCIVVRNAPALADYAHGLLSTISAHSYQLGRGGGGERSQSSRAQQQATSEAAFELALPPGLPDPIASRRAFSARLSSALRELTDPRGRGVVDCAPPGEQADTWVTLATQLGRLGVSQDDAVLDRFVRLAPEGAHLRLASAYLNPPPPLLQALSHSRAKLTLLTAAEGSHGWSGARGAAALVPQVYSVLREQLLERLQGRAGNSELLEYERPGWVFHAKGVWAAHKADGGGDPYATVVGSSNYGYRSWKRDLEVQATIATDSSQLRGRLRKEWEALAEGARRAAQVTARPVAQKAELANAARGASRGGSARGRALGVMANVFKTYL